MGSMLYLLYVTSIILLLFFIFGGSVKNLERYNWKNIDIRKMEKIEPNVRTEEYINEKFVI